MKKLLIALMLAASSLSMAATELTAENTKSELDKNILAGKVVVIEFYTSWCGACKIMKPMFEKAEKNLQGKAEFFLVNVDSGNKLATLVNAIPTIIVLKRAGANVVPIVGVPNSQEELEAQILERMK